jgi:hypothetical protein
LTLLLLASLLPILVFAIPDEASGVVTNVVDGDTFDLRIIEGDPRIVGGRRGAHIHYMPGTIGLAK